MAADTHAAADFYATPRGRVAARLLRDRLTLMWPDLRGQSVLGIGFAATRDINAFFRSAAKDDVGFANPVAGKVKAAAAGKRHGMIKRSNKFIRDARGTMVLAKPDGVKVIKNYLPNGL